ncbi:E3 ubiquitin-protein ligase, ATL family [Zostera marina]|uniref:E3 ubiquitin-protein ligase, ATL family n=1 Tax=Zostera marina TaxID=29655 RepID=A0A0K9P8B5_ZOSMR|nr:E3 ubiquitin-protein ligase, ATL family [Zostera marina]
MGFPVGCSDIILPKLLLQVLFLLSQLRTLISKALTLLDSPTTATEPPHWTNLYYSTKPNPIAALSAGLIKEILPSVRYDEVRGEDEEEDERCTICLSEFGPREEVRLLKNCRHVFHSKCFDPWLDLDQRTCPLCRTELVPVEMMENFDTKLRHAEAAADDDADADGINSYFISS